MVSPTCKEVLDVHGVEIKCERIPHKGLPKDSSFVGVHRCIIGGNTLYWEPIKEPYQRAEPVPEESHE